MKQLLFLISFFLLEISPNGSAQVVSQRTQPSDLPSFLQTIASDNIPFFALQPIDKGVIEKFAEEDKISGRAPHFGQSRQVDIGFNAGSWQYSDMGRIWTMGITSSGAKGFMVIFDKLVLAENATMYLFNKNRNILVGAIDATANNPNPIFSSDLVEGDSIIIALIEPPMNFGKTQLHISNLLYAYQLPYAFDVADNPTAILSCHRDVSCPEGVGREDISKTVAMIFDPIGGRWCSGSLLNNSCNDLRPTFFTAFHCADFDENRILSQNEITRVNNWVFRFGYKTATCGGADNRDWQSISSCNLIAQSESSDGILLELLNKPKATSGIAYAGWTTQTNNISQLVSLHHPRGNPMKISLDNQAPIFTTVPVGDATLNFFLRYPMQFRRFGT